MQLFTNDRSSTSEDFPSMIEAEHIELTSQSNKNSPSERQSGKQPDSSIDSTCFTVEQH